MGYNYNWKLQSTDFKKNKGTVFSCFACGGGSTMGYKMSGFDVIGCNEIDPKMMEVYKKNHNPKYSFQEPIQSFKLRSDLPSELYSIDILDGSPPCSSFSMSGTREKDWGVKRKFKEGQEEQVLDTLFFDFIDLANKLRPKVAIAENVKGILSGNAIKYARKVLYEFNKAGYEVTHYVLDSSKMGVPQKRERVFFIAVRKDIATKISDKLGLTDFPYINMEFNSPPIPFSEISEEITTGECKMYPSSRKYWKLTKEGESFSVPYEKENNKRGMFNYRKVDPNKPLSTITAHTEGGGDYHHLYERTLSRSELIKGGSFPSDYNFLNLNAKYVIGMSVPPVMMANIADRIYEYVLSKI